MSEKLLEVLQSKNCHITFWYADIFVTKPITGVKIIEIDGEEKSFGVRLEVDPASSLEIYWDDLILFEQLKPAYHDDTLQSRYRLYLEDATRRQIYKFTLFTSE